jgi:hypothetical protein
VEVHSFEFSGAAVRIFALMMTNFGFQPGILDFWMLLTDWQNGSLIILLTQRGGVTV